ncbi:MAG: dephospho-CoA kinase [Gemmatimonadales bacterium]|nr:MAG: dephospho-CoA kinase [Gemmatimonadales bacterium]
MIRVGLTGNVASGKSSVARLWARWGIPVVSADELAREVVEPGTEGLQAVTEAFGPEVRSEDGSLDRAALRAIVFRDPEARRRLEGILHPLIGRRRDRWESARRAEGARLVVSEVPLLFEAGLENRFDRVVAVTAPREERLRRMEEDRGLEQEEALRIMGAQEDPPEDGHHHRIANDAGRVQLEVRARAVLDLLRDEAELPSVRIRLDLHLHTRGSWDCLSDPEEVLDRARARGIHRIAVTDHDRLSVALELAERFPEHVIAGEEVKTAEGVDVIGWYLSREIPGRTPAREVCTQIREQGGLVYLPHPFARGKGGSGRLAEALAPHLDAVEVFNARLQSAHRNRRAAAFSVQHDLPGGAGSDAHTVGEVGYTFVEVPHHASTPEHLLEALRHGRVHGRRAPLAVFAASNWAKLARRVGLAPDAPPPAASPMSSD